MRRLFLVFILIGAIFAQSYVDVHAAIQVTPASPELTAQISKTMEVWAGRMTRHDRRAFDMMSDDSKMLFFGTTDEVTIWQRLGTYPMKVSFEDVANPQMSEDGNVKALVSISGYQSQYGYLTFYLTFRDDGGKYLTMVDVAFPTPVLFPGETTPAEADLVITVPVDQSQLELSLDESDYILIEFNNQDEDTAYHLFYLFEKNVAHQTSIDAEDILAQVGVSSGKVEQMALAGLPAGEYILMDFLNGKEVLEISLTIQ